MSKKIEAIIKKITPVLEKYKVKKASIFGSFARGEEKVGSDLDILVELGEIGGLLSMVALKRELETASMKRVDLLTYRSIHPLLKKYVRRDEIKIYG
ncbi:MAG: nucleotidyltransferase domain-containing protein [Patescibacteria group bacterium]